jgi:tetratricopeptide (TPR) repeat protein
MRVTGLYSCHQTNETAGLAARGQQEKMDSYETQTATQDLRESVAATAALVGRNTDTAASNTPQAFYDQIQDRRSTNRSDRRLQARRTADQLELLAAAKPKKDNWDKIGAVAPIISGVMIFLMGGYFTYAFNQQQLKLQEIQTIERFIPHLMGNEQSKKAAILAISSLTNAELAAKFANIFASTGTVSALQKMADSGSEKEKTVASKALSDAMETLAEHDNKLSGIEASYKHAIESSDGSDHESSADLAYNLCRLAEIYTIKGQYQLAEPLLTKALTIRETTYGAESPMVANTLKTMAEMYQGAGQIEQSQACLKRARSIETKLPATPAAPAAAPAKPGNVPPPAAQIPSIEKAEASSQLQPAEKEKEPRANAGSPEPKPHPASGAASAAEADHSSM